MNCLMNFRTTQIQTRGWHVIGSNTSVLYGRGTGHYNSKQTWFTFILIDEVCSRRTSCPSRHYVRSHQTGHHFNFIITFLLSNDSCSQKRFYDFKSPILRLSMGHTVLFHILLWTQTLSPHFGRCSRTGSSLVSSTLLYHRLVCQRKI